MKTFLFASGFLLASSVASLAEGPESRTYDTPQWSATVDGLQAKVTLVEKEKYNGTRQIFVFLELKNARDLAHPLKIPCDDGHVKFELVDVKGKIVRDGWSFSRSGSHADPGVVSLPFDSEIKINMHCTNWGVPKDAAAQVSTDSGSWVIKAEEKGKVYLRATLKSDLKEPHPDNFWKGTLVTPPVKLNWMEE